MNTKGSITVFSLCFLTLFMLTDCSTCQISKVEGESHSFKLADRPIKDNDRITVTKDSKIEFQKKNNVKIPEKMKKGVLELHNMKMSDSGTYSIEVFDGDGTKLKEYSETLCVYAKVLKPNVNITCKTENKMADLTCDVGGHNITGYSWQKNGKKLSEKKPENVLQNIKADDSKYTCTAHNPVHDNTSDQVEVVCFKPLTLFGFDFWIMVSILTGGGALVLLLIIVLVTLSCRACKRREKQQQDEEEYRLNHLNSSPIHGNKSKQTARGQPAPPEPYDNVCAQEVPCQAEPKPRSQQRARPPPPPIEDEEEQPPPLPQPRTKAHPKKREGPM